MAKEQVTKTNVTRQTAVTMPLAKALLDVCDHITILPS